MPSACRRPGVGRRRPLARSPARPLARSPARPLDGGGRKASRRARSSRSKRSPSCSRSRDNVAMRQEIESYVRSLGLDAFLVGGAVGDELLGLESKDADFLVPAVATEQLRAALAPHGRVEDLVVADRLVGVRLHPIDAGVRALAPAGIEFAPPRKEVSTGPGRHDFE